MMSMDSSPRAGKYGIPGMRIVTGLLASQRDETGSVSGCVTGFSHVGIMPDDAAGRRVFSGISRFPAPSLRCHTILTSITSSSATKTSLLRAVQCSLLYCYTSLHFPCLVQGDSLIEGEAVPRRCDLGLGNSTNVGPLLLREMKQLDDGGSAGGRKCLQIRLPICQLPVVGALQFTVYYTNLDDAGLVKKHVSKRGPISVATGLVWKRLRTGASAVGEISAARVYKGPWSLAQSSWVKIVVKYACQRTRGAILFQVKVTVPSWRKTLCQLFANSTRMSIAFPSRAVHRYIIIEMGLCLKICKPDTLDITIEAYTGIFERLACSKIVGLPLRVGFLLVADARKLSVLRVEAILLRIRHSASPAVLHRFLPHSLTHNSLGDRLKGCCRWLTIHLSMEHRSMVQLAMQLSQMKNRMAVLQSPCQTFPKIPGNCGRHIGTPAKEVGYITEEEEVYCTAGTPH
ncbi:hypothetical protein PR048_009669 [Dryococelus australis]|uniref:Uncharacterized protein n=1 Tax=Dryococelus australis TaxID=614101 RepID=A0ABQ9I0I5_9NEOP|nr:hypothetical protein PR048_009669 [Dryococelus australis]